VSTQAQSSGGSWQSQGPDQVQAQGLPRRPMQLRVRHVTGYTYAEGAAASYNEARLTPLTTSDQVVLRSRIDVTPTAWSQEYRDYWGTVVTAFEVQEPHETLTVVATSTVESTPHPVEAPTVGWDDLATVADEWCEFLVVDDWVRPADGLLVELERLRAASATPAEHVAAVTELVRAHVRYLPGATAVTTTAAEAWEAGAGVCQDLVHVTLGALRLAGIPARYVSGYLHPSPQPVVGETVEGESHAWVEYWDGDWRGVDPTNAVVPGERHVLVGRGRHYGDVTPLRGIYSTQGESELFVSVEITRLR
jgi:transglutaminase-like putative cysteine protease